MIKIKTLWFFSGIVNVGFVLPTNINFFYKRYNEERSSQMSYFQIKDESALDTFMNTFGICYLYAMCVGFKSTCYYFSGPVGTYRLLLGFKNYKSKNDIKFLEPITTMGTFEMLSHKNYIMKPFGNQPWI